MRMALLFAAIACAASFGPTTALLSRRIASQPLPNDTPTQCAYETTTGCSGPPKWDVRWDMASSTYTYCFGNCPLPWLADHTDLGVWAGVVGVDHYYTKQGMPCINGLPHEFESQDNFTIQTKQTFPQSRVLQYRITSAVPYAPVVHDAMISNPDYFLNWHHAPNNNGSICLMPYEEHGTENQNCSWPITAAAYNWSNADARSWWLENVIQPVMVHADGAWIDGDGPDNGAWMCSGSYQWGQLPAPYPALNSTEVDSFCVGEINVTASAQEWLIANGGFDYNCFDFVNSPTQLPNETDSPATCAAKVQALQQHKPGGGTSAVVLYGDRTDSKGYNDATVSQAVAVFMIVRSEYWWMSFLSGDTFNTTTAAFLLSDYGAPLGNMTSPSQYVFQRQYASATVTMDCNTFTASFATTE